MPHTLMIRRESGSGRRPRNEGAPSCEDNRSGSGLARPRNTFEGGTPNTALAIRILNQALHQNQGRVPLSTLLAEVVRGPLRRLKRWRGAREEETAWWQLTRLLHVVDEDPRHPTACGRTNGPGEVLVDSWILSSGKILEMLEGLEHAETQPAHLSDLAPDDHQCDVPLCILLRRAVDID